MTDFNVNFRGLFTVVRHIEPPLSGQRVTSEAEPMSIVFAVDDGGAGGHGHEGHLHNVAVRVQESAVADGVGIFSQLPIPVTPASVDGWVTLDIKNKTVWLPANGRYDAVRHEPDEEVGEFGFEVTCAKVGAVAERWRPLTRLGNLNALTGGAFDVNVNGVDARVQSVVRLSGGSIGCLRSYKALADAFFEFYDEYGTITVQPGVEDVQYTVPADPDGFVRIGFGELGAAAPGVVVPFRTDTPLIIDSLPPPGAPIAPDLNHFGNFYKLMALRAGGPEKLRRPLVRMASRCENNQIVCTMGGREGIHRSFLAQFAGPDFFTTPGVCECLVAQAFRPL
jgi:hypothetical protein